MRFNYSEISKLIKMIEDIQTQKKAAKVLLNSGCKFEDKIS